VFTPKTVPLAAATETKVTLAFSKPGRLLAVSQARLLIAGQARDDAGGTATQTVARNRLRLTSGSAGYGLGTGVAGGLAKEAT
jgi:hypothetical protein